MKYFAVRCRQDVAKYASPHGWAPFERATVFSFRDDSLELIETFMRKGIDKETSELVEVSFTPVDLSN